MSMAASIAKHVSKVRVSSVLNRDVKQFGKQFLFDGCDETCWNSDQGSQQYINIEFSNAVRISEVQIQFQGGFSGKYCRIECYSQYAVRSENMLLTACDFYPEDINSLQRFPVDFPEATSILRIVFESSTDFFGRIIIYKLDILGQSA